jgi:hypothetical protein
MSQNQQTQEKEVNKCAFSCGRITTGVIRLTQKIDLRLCDTCHHLLDVSDTMTWIPY